MMGTVDFEHEFMGTMKNEMIDTSRLTKRIRFNSIKILYVGVN